jgi:hypothetical protein
MPLVPVDLPAPNELRNRWAAYAAVMAALGFGDLSNATPQRWHYDDAGGNWAELVLLDDGRALLFGHDGEYSETYFREAAEYFEEEETDLLADAPDWWGSVLPRGEDLWIGFVYGFENDVWQRADYDLEDGFESVGNPAFFDARLQDLVAEFINGRGTDAGIEHTPASDAITALSERGPLLTEEDLAAVFGPVSGDLVAGVAAARAFS